MFVPKYLASNVDPPKACVTASEMLLKFDSHRVLYVNGKCLDCMIVRLKEEAAKIILNVSEIFWFVYIMNGRII